MPSRIRPGFKVQARLGPFALEQIGHKNGVPSTSKPSEGNPKRTRKVRSIITGWVVSAGSDSSKIRTLGGYFGLTCDHHVRSLTVVCNFILSFETAIFHFSAWYLEIITRRRSNYSTCLQLGDICLK